LAIRNVESRRAAQLERRFIVPPSRARGTHFSRKIRRGFAPDSRMVFVMTQNVKSVIDKGMAPTLGSSALSPLANAAGARTTLRLIAPSQRYCSPGGLAMTLTKVVCVICDGIFKVEQAPPIEIVEPMFDMTGHPSDAYESSALSLTDDAASVAYCRQNCPWCRPDSPWSGDVPHDEEDTEE
jgi:hypothetical protein